MHGHSLSGSRKLNRHWQSGRKSTTLNENLVLLDRDIDVTEWVASESPYWIFTSETVHSQLLSHQIYTKRNKERNRQGFKELVILQPGNYKVHWNLRTRLIESFTKDDVLWERLTEQNADARFGMFGVIMYGLGQQLSIATQEPYYIIDNNITGRYYCGRAEDYIAQYSGSSFSSATWYINDEIVQNVSPYRNSTSSWLGGANTFNMVSGQEQPEVILHIGDKAPFPQYEITRDTENKTAFFRINKLYSSPAISFLFCENVSSLSVYSWAILGKIWLERVSNYTQPDRRWLPEILTPPTGYTIIGDGGIL